MATPMKMQHTYHEQVEILVGVCIFFSATTNYRSLDELFNPTLPH